MVSARSRFIGRLVLMEIKPSIQQMCSPMMPVNLSMMLAAAQLLMVEEVSTKRQNPERVAAVFNKGVESG